MWFRVGLGAGARKSVRVVGGLRRLCRNGTGGIFTASRSNIMVISCGSSTATFGNRGGKAVVNGNMIGGGVSGCMFNLLRGSKIPARFVGRLDSHRATIGGISVIPLRMVMEGITTNDFSGEVNIPRKGRLLYPVLRFDCGGSRLNSPFVGSSCTLTLKLTARSRVSAVGGCAEGMGRYLGGCFLSTKVGLVSFGVRFNELPSNAVVLTSRVSPSAYHL